MVRQRARRLRALARPPRGHPAQLLGSLVEQEGLSGHVVSLHTTDASTRAHKQVKRGGPWQIIAMKRRWPGGLSEAYEKQCGPLSGCRRKGAQKTGVRGTVAPRHA